MNTFTTKDGTSIYYKDWGTGPVVTFSHGWPLSADAWDAQMLFLGQRGYRVIAHDRRGHGRSGQTWQGNNMDQYADDLAELMNHLDLKDATMVGHSTGGGEVVRYIARHGQNRVSQGGSDFRCSATDAQDGEESGRFAAFGFRRDSRRCRQGSLPVFQGPEPSVLWVQQTGRKSIRGRSGIVLVARDASLDHWRLRLHLTYARRPDAAAGG